MVPPSPPAPPQPTVPAPRCCGRPKGSQTARDEEQPNLLNDINTPRQIKRYHGFLTEFMSYYHGCRYPKSRVYTDKELSTITPDPIYK